MMIFAEDPLVAGSWWADLLECPHDRVSVDGGFVRFDVGDIEFGIHPLDAATNPVAGSPVIHLRVDDRRVQAVRATTAVARAVSKSARLHRGPLAFDDSRSIAQMVDPFGNVVGFDGPLVP